jgi:hypothetical protein
MHGRQSQLTSIQARKQLLLAESAVNRAQLVHECTALAQCLSVWQNEFRSFASTVSTILNGIKAVNGFMARGKSSVTATLFKAARTGLSFWGSALSWYRK